MGVLALLDLVDLYLHAKGQLLLKIVELALINFNELLFACYKGVIDHIEHVLMVTCLGIDLTDVGLISADVVLLLLLLAIAIRLLCLCMLLVLLGHDVSSSVLDVLDSNLVLILKMLHFLQVRNN